MPGGAPCLTRPAILSIRNPARAQQGLILRDDMQEYYRARAAEYDLFYDTPDRWDELARLKAWLIERTTGRTVLEVAAGTGYWTEVVAHLAGSVTATDLNPETLAIAAKRRLGANVHLVAADAHCLPHFTTAFDVGMAHLWWSHLEKQRRISFISHFASRLVPGASLLMIDQLYVEGFSRPISRKDEWGNQYAIRRLKDGRSYEIVKNFPGPGEPEDGFGELCTDIQVLRLHHFWALSARLRQP
jgi:SAM-dependent methyltransferase